MSDLYTSAFVSKDFVEGDVVERAEVFVVVGRGTVHEVNASGSGKSKQVIIDAGKEYKGRPLYSKGWAPTDSDVIKKAEEALEKGEVVDFRIETVRNKGVDRSTPISELKTGMENARENVMHSIATIKLESEENWTEGILRTNPKEDKRKTGRTAADLADDELDSGSSKSSNGGSYSGYSNSVEPQAWVGRTQSGNVNPGSYHVAALSNIYGFVADWNREHDDVELSTETIRRVSKGLLSIANKLQVRVFDGELEAPELDKQSHTRARAIIFETIKNQYPLTKEIAEDTDELKGWLKNLYTASLEQWLWSIEGVSDLV